MTAQDRNAARSGTARDQDTRTRKPWDGLKGAAATEAKEELALTLQLAGYSLTAIARECEYADHGGAGKAVARARAKLDRQPLKDMRMLELTRLDTMHRGLWTKAIAGHIPSINACLSIMDRRAKLVGLDAPTRLEVTTVDELEAWAKELDDLIEAEEKRIREGNA